LPGRAFFPKTAHTFRERALWVVFGRFFFLWRSVGINRIDRPADDGPAGLRPRFGDTGGRLDNRAGDSRNGATRRKQREQRKTG